MNAVPRLESLERVAMECFGQRFPMRVRGRHTEQVGSHPAQAWPKYRAPQTTGDAKLGCSEPGTVAPPGRRAPQNGLALVLFGIAARHSAPWVCPK